MPTNMQIAVTTAYKSDDKRKYKQLLRGLINNSTIGHLRIHVIIINHIIWALGAIEMGFYCTNNYN